MTSGGCVVAQPHYRINLITLLWWRPDQLSIGANQSQHRPVLRKVAHRPCAARMTSVNASGRAKELIRGIANPFNAARERRSGPYCRIRPRSNLATEVT